MENLKFALYTGCTAKESTPELLKSTLAIGKALGIEFVILKEASCCGASHLQDFDEFLSLVLNARNICYAEKLGLPLVTLCNTCQLNLSLTKYELDSKEDLREKVNIELRKVNLEYKGTSEVKHLLYVLKDVYGFDNIKSKITKPLKDLNVAPFYGCHNIRPTFVQKNGENPYTPNSLDLLIEILGGNSINYSNKNRCCGFHADLQAPHTAHLLSGNALLDAKDNNADMVVTPCPLCHLNFDVKQKSISKEVGRDIDLPILHLAQLIGMALGISSEELGFKHHIIKVD